MAGHRCEGRKPAKCAWGQRLEWGFGSRVFRAAKPHPTPGGRKEQCCYRNPPINAIRCSIFFLATFGTRSVHAAAAPPLQEMEIAMQRKPPKEPKTKPAEKSPVKQKSKTKQQQLIAMLQRPQGATIDQLTKALQWQRHTVRGTLSGALKKRLGLTIRSEPHKAGRVYRIISAGGSVP